MYRFLFICLCLIVALNCAEDTTISPTPVDTGIVFSFPEPDISFDFDFEECPTFSPSLPAYDLPLDAQDVLNTDAVLDFYPFTELSPLLLTQGFAYDRRVLLGDEPADAFRRIRNDDIPFFVSSGIVLHSFHLVFDRTLAYLERKYLFNDLSVLINHLYPLAVAREDALSASYLAVAASLLDPSFIPDAFVEDIVDEELALIREHSGFAESPIFGYGEDYSQYIPRGHYSGDEKLENYFLASMWLGRMTFILEGGEPFGSDATYLISAAAAEEQTLAAAAIAADLTTDAPGEITLKDVWYKIYSTTALFSGFSDDLSVPQYLRGVSSLTGMEGVNPDLLDSRFYGNFIVLVDSLYPPPAIYSGTGESGVYPGGSEADILAKTRGFRLLGQRYTLDSDIFTSLVYPAVGINSAGEYRTMPTGLDIAGVFGNDLSIDLLEESGSFTYAGYSDNITFLRNNIADISVAEWHSTLYMAWLNTLTMLFELRESGYPTFMTVPQWGVKQLTSFLASWAMLRHDTILYAKQSYTAQLVSIPPEPVKPSVGFVEPLPDVYHELVSMLSMLQSVLEEEGMLDDQLRYDIGNALEFTIWIRDISIIELECGEFAEEQIEFLASLPARLDEIATGGEDVETGMETTLIADVHTDQNTGEVLEVASGDLDLMFVVFPRPDGQLEIAAGPVLSYYEFTVPMAQRMTDLEWRESFYSGKPDSPWWVITD